MPCTHAQPAAAVQRPIVAWQVVAKRQLLLEKLADVDEEVAELYLLEEEPTVELLMTAIRRQTIARNFVPVCMGSAFKNKVALTYYLLLATHYLLLATCYRTINYVRLTINYLHLPLTISTRRVCTPCSRQSSTTCLRRPRWRTPRSTLAPMRPRWR